MGEAIKIDGLNQFARNLRKLDNDLPKALRIGFNEAAGIVVTAAKPLFPRRTGKAASTVRVASTRTAVRVVEGGNRASYVPWLDFGGKVGRKKSVHRPFIGDGRFLYPSFYKHGEEVHEAIVKALLDVAEQSGVVVD